MITVKRIIPAYIILFLICFFPSTAISSGCGCPFEIWIDTVQPQTNFVKVPTIIGNLTGGMAGLIVGGAVGLPIGLVLAPLTEGESIGVGVYGGAMYGACTLMLPTGFILGAPFYVIEKVFWDFPNWLIGSKEEEKKEEELDE